MSAAGGGGISISINSTANTSGVAAMQTALAGLDSTSRATSGSAGGVGESFERSMGRAGTATNTFGNLFNSFAQGMAQHSKIGGALYQTSQFFQSFNDGGVAALTKGLGLLGGAFGGVIGVAESFIGNIATIVTSLGVFDAFSFAAAKVRELSQEMVTLNETTQSQYVGWGYLFGDQNGPNFDASSQMLGWTASESYNMPFTRQDMHSAISTLQTLGLPPEAIQHYLPILADLAVRNPGITLDRIAMSVMGAQFGLTRMLRYDLRITPEQLQQFGLDFEDGKHIDPKTLLPALENYASSMGYYSPTGPNGEDVGASYMLAHNTFQGASTSLTDRIQNILTELGGTLWTDQTGPNGQAATDANAPLQKLQDALTQDQKNKAPPDKLAADQKAIDDYLALFGGGISVRNIEYGMPGHEGEGQYVQKALGQAGDVQKGTFFDMMITGLNAITNWWDLHQKDMTKLADLFANVMGEGMKDAGNALVSFAEGLQGSGIGQQILDGIQHAAAWLADPQHQQQIEHLAEVLGDKLGRTIQDVWSHVQDLGTAWGNLMSAFGNGDKAQGAANVIGGIGDVIGWVLDRISSFVDMWAYIIKGFEAIGNGDWGSALRDFEDASVYFASNSLLGIGPNPNQIVGQATQQATQPAAPSNGGGPTDQGAGGGGGVGGGGAGFGGFGGGGGGHIGGLAMTLPQGPTTSYGDTSHNYYIYGASGQQVQQIVDASQTQQNQQALATARRPGGMRFRTFGLY